ncbi:hypothetical protein XELAEV_18003892mg [Xenopus laevis]|uniref:Uncharacterized protein n=1 Tax=Xenopus laevis TaxID=8355 RepID=A0A974GYF4_XENLA|nr:hypothetical protein XELAEV_18003892mg [Xenopus laevis]
MVVEKQKPKIEIKERVNEVFIVEPETKKEIARLKSVLQELGSRKSMSDKEFDTVHSQVLTLKIPETHSGV